VRLEVEGHRYTVPLIVKMDPRVTTPLAALRQEWGAETRLVSLMNSLYQPLAQARSLDADCGKLSQQVKGSTAEDLGVFSRKLLAILGAPGGFFAPLPPEPALSRMSAAVASLYEAVSGVDAAPTTSQANALTRIERGLPDLMSRWEALKSIDLPAINRRLRASGLPELKLEPGPRPSGPSQNEE
jgi:hypothetical protein